MPERYLHDLFLKSPNGGDPTISPGEVSVLLQCLTFLTIRIFFLMSNPNPSCCDSRLLLLVLSTLGLSYRLFSFSYISLSCYHISQSSLLLDGITTIPLPFIHTPYFLIILILFWPLLFKLSTSVFKFSRQKVDTVHHWKHHWHQAELRSCVLSSLRKRCFIGFNPQCICSSGCKGLLHNSS